MVFVEFVSPDYPFEGAKHYFVGVSYEAVMADTNGGTKFGFASFSSHREITEEEALRLNLGFLMEGVESVRAGRSKSFNFKTPD